MEKYRFFEKPSHELLLPTAPPLLLQDEEAPYWPSYKSKVRIGQGAFRTRITEAYARKCAITGEKTLPVLEAAHIKPYAEAGPNPVSNGMLLRSDFHTLYDAGYLTVDEKYRIEVSGRIREEFNNGKEYYNRSSPPLSGRLVIL